MAIPTEPIGSIPRPPQLLQAITSFHAGKIASEVLDNAYKEALRDTIDRLEQTGSPILTDGEQTKPTQRPIKQAVISASALSLLYPRNDIPGYSQDAFISDLIDEAEADIRGALDTGAASVQIDFTEGRLSLKLDPSGSLLSSFVELNNKVLGRFSPDERRKIGVHVCPGGDRDSTHSADVDYADFLPDLFKLNVGRFYLQMASEPDKKRILQLVSQLTSPQHLVFIGVIDPINPVVETAVQVRDRILEAASFLPVKQLGTTDDCGFAPFADDTSTARDTAFQKIQARVEGTALAARELSC